MWKIKFGIECPFIRNRIDWRGSCRTPQSARFNRFLAEMTYIRIEVTRFIIDDSRAAFPTSNLFNTQRTKFTQAWVPRNHLLWILLVPDFLWNGIFSGRLPARLAHRWLHSRDSKNLSKNLHDNKHFLAWMAKVCDPTLANSSKVPSWRQILSMRWILYLLNSSM